MHGPLEKITVKGVIGFKSNVMFDTLNTEAKFGFAALAPTEY